MDTMHPKRMPILHLAGGWPPTCRCLFLLTCLGTILAVPACLAAGKRRLTATWHRQSSMAAGCVPLRIGQLNPSGDTPTARVGLHPMRGPRGLLRIYAPYLDQPDGRVINYIAVEPIVRGDAERGQSELEYSQLDQTRGKRFWSASRDNDGSPQATDHPSRGWFDRIGGIAPWCVRWRVILDTLSFRVLAMFLGTVKPPNRRKSRNGFSKSALLIQLK